MAKFRVTVKEVHYINIDIDADNEEHARIIAEDVICTGEYPDGEELQNSEYDYTMDSDDWDVQELLPSGKRFNPNFEEDEPDATPVGIWKSSSIG